MLKTILWTHLTIGLPFYFSTIQPNRDIGPSKGKHGIPVQLAADYIHAVLEANRTVYATYIVQRLANAISLHATENWERENTLPLPAQFLALSANISRAKHRKMSYRLASPWPVNRNNAPRSEFEYAGLRGVVRDPEKPYTRLVRKEGKPYFQAVYADKAMTESCVTYHNRHAQTRFPGG
ncbi:MAG: DUF3365 domain-containing protein [Nitrospinaceae bacterium]